jgi:SOS-response transcriptional repressor LexA
VINTNTKSEKQSFQSVISIAQMKTLGSRIAHYRKAADLSQAELAKACGWGSQSRIGNYEKDIREPSIDDLRTIARALKIGLGELLPIGNQSSAPELSNVLPVAQPERLYRYPVVSEVQAGAWTDAVQPYEPGAEDQFELTDYQARGPAFWLRVNGDSMTSLTPPSIPEGCFVLVDTGLTAQPGDLVVAKLDTEEKATFKKLVSDAGQLYLKPLNPAYRVIPIDGNCRLIGVVKEAKMKL